MTLLLRREWRTKESNLEAVAEQVKRRPGGAPPRSVRRPGVEQSLAVINVPGAMLKLETLAQISGRSVGSLYLDAKRGSLELTKLGTRCTRVTSENARAYLARLSGASA